MAAFSAAGVRPVGFGTVWTRGSSPYELGGDLVGTVRGRPERDHHLHLAVVLLLEDVPDGVAQMPLLVEDRHDHGDGGCVAFIAGATLPRTGDTGAAAGRCGRRRSYGPTVLRGSPCRPRRCPPLPTPPRSPPARPPPARPSRRPDGGRAARPGPRPVERPALGHAGGDDALGAGAGRGRHRARGGHRPGHRDRPGRPVQGHEEPARGRATA